MSEKQQSSLLSKEILEQLDHWLTKFPAEQKQSAVIPALSIVQEANGGWLTEPLMDAVAEYLEMPKIAVYEVATFYSMYELEPVGRYKISICTNISCQLRGCDKIIDHLHKKLGIGLGETSKDGLFTLKSVECLAACGGAPMFQINEKEFYEDLTPAKVDTILDDLAKKEKAHGK